MIQWSWCHDVGHRWYRYVVRDKCCGIGSMVMWMCGMKRIGDGMMLIVVRVGVGHRDVMWALVRRAVKMGMMWIAVVVDVVDSLVGSFLTRIVVVDVVH